VEFLDVINSLQLEETHSAPSGADGAGGLVQQQEGGPKAAAYNYYPGSQDGSSVMSGQREESFSPIKTLAGSVGGTPSFTMEVSTPSTSAPARDTLDTGFSGRSTQQHRIPLSPQTHERLANAGIYPPPSIGRTHTGGGSTPRGDRQQPRGEKKS